MELEIGIVCGRCDSYAALGNTTCPSCAAALALDASSEVPASSSSKPPPTTRESAEVAMPGLTLVSDRTRDLGKELGTMSQGISPQPFPSPERRASEVPSRGGRLSPGQLAAVKSSKPKSVEELMDQAKNFVCRSCSTPVPVGHKFCGRCGAAVPVEIMTVRTQFFGQLQAPGKAKLILIRGEGVEGLSYQLNAEQHIVGKAGQLVFPDDPFVSPRHANFFYKNGTLCVRDEGSLNGVYLRVRGSIDLAPEDHFLAGEQVFRFDLAPVVADIPEADGTYFYASPKHHSGFRVTQLLHGGGYGMTVCARNPSLLIGREGGDLNFPTDLYMSGSHCKLEESGGHHKLTDMSSRNGTYVRLKAERELAHGDYLFIGRKLLRVEITAA